MSSTPRPTWGLGPLIGWALYDFGNTIFSLAVITRYFNDWYIIQENGRDIEVGLMGFVVGLVLVVVMPAMGAISDQVGRRLPFLAVFTASCLLATVGIGLAPNPTIGLVIAGVAIFSYQLALSMYDPLLAVVAEPGKHGSASGFGVGMGYVGVLIGSVAIAAWIEGPGNSDSQAAFIPTAVLFAIFALPIFLLVREAPPKPLDTKHPIGTVIHGAIQQVHTTVAHIRAEHRNTGRFLIARFLYVDAVATVIGVMTVYAKRLKITEDELTVLLAISMVAAAIGAFVAGRLVLKVGPKRVLTGILTIATTVLLVAGITGSASVVWVLGPLVGITLGSVWTSDRVIMMRLSPPELRGEFFAVYNLVGKLSSGFGPLILWGGTIYVLYEVLDLTSKLGASRVALIALAAAVVAGLFVLRRVQVPDHDLVESA